MTYRGSCHCGRIAFEVEGELAHAMDCNCSYCSRKGSVLWFVPRDHFTLLTNDEDLASYSFGKKSIQYRFCPSCGVHAYGEGTDPTGKQMVAVNVRCLEDVNLDELTVQHFDGRAL
jgi:hypothetical protein